MNSPKAAFSGMPNNLLIVTTPVYFCAGAVLTVGIFTFIPVFQDSFNS
jgi:hypothetical protein